MTVEEMQAIIEGLRDKQTDLEKLINAVKTKNEELVQSNRDLFLNQGKKVEKQEKEVEIPTMEDLSDKWVKELKEKKK